MGLGEGGVVGFGKCESIDKMGNPWMRAKGCVMMSVG